MTLLPAAHAQTLVSDTFEDAGTSATRKSRDTGAVPGAIPFYLGTTTANANTSLSTVSPITGSGSLRISNNVGVAGVFDATTAGADFSQVGTTYTLTMSLQFATTPVLGTLRIGLLDGINTSTSLLTTFSDHNYGSDNLTGLHGRFVTTSSGAGSGSNTDGAFYQPGNSGSFIGGSGLSGSSIAGTYLANAFGGNIGTTAFQYRLSLTRTSTGITETTSYATSATVGTFFTEQTVNISNANMANPVNSLNMIGIYNLGTGSDLLVDNVSLVRVTSSATPEPGSLPLLFAGVPLLGVVLRRGRRKTS